MGPIHRTRPYGEGRWDGVGWRRRSVFGALALRPPLADVTAAELELMREAAAGARRIVEIGVFEGATGAELGSVIEPGGELVLIDPYPPGGLFGLNMAKLTAARAVRGSVEADVRWLRETSTDAVKGWDQPIDFLRIDGLHTLEGVRRDWIDWSPFLVPGGRVALRCDVVAAGADEHVQGDEIVPWILARESEWELAGRVETTAVLRRAGGPAAANPF